MVIGVMADPAKSKGMRNCKPKKPSYSDETLRKAISDIREGGASIRSVSSKYGIPRSTIQDRLHCRVTDGPRRMGPAPVLGLEGEKKISKYIIEMAKRGFPLNKKTLIKTVQNIVKESGQKNPFKDGIPGQKWLMSFLKRHPEISLRVPENISKDRALVTEATIRKWFKNLREYLSEINASDVLDDADRILNGDESGFSLCPKTGKVLAPKGYKNVYEVKMSKEKENITVLVMFTASGKICPPLVVFPYVRPPRAVVQSMPKQWVLGRSESGWMRGDIFFEYISNDFNNWLIVEKIKKPVLLLIDGHKSHMTLPLSEFCESNGIILYTLPPRTTHMLQPADVSVFRPLKQGWKNTVREFQSESNDPWNSAVTKTNFCPLFEKALNAFDMTQQIKNGFKKCGLFPLNEEAVDYTKCVKDNAKLGNRRSSTGVTCADIDIAIKVIQAANLDSKHGIDTNLILKELNNMKSKTGQRKSTPRRKSPQKPTPKSTPKENGSQKSTPKSTPKDKGSQKSTPKSTPKEKGLQKSTPKSTPDKNVPLLDTPNVCSYISLNDISVIPLDLGDSESMIASNILGSNIQLLHTSDNSNKTHVSELSDNLLTNWRDLNTLLICSEDIQTEMMATNTQTPFDTAFFNKDKSGQNIQYIISDSNTAPQVQVIETSHYFTKDPSVNLDSQNAISTCDVTTAQIHKERNVDIQPRTEDRNNRFISNCIIGHTEDQIQLADCSETLITRENSTESKKPEPLSVIQSDDPFVKHLMFPEPDSNSTKTSIQKKKRAIIPNAISSEAWRKHFEVQEKEKKEKEEAVIKRKILRMEAKENKQKEKMSKQTKVQCQNKTLKGLRGRNQQNTKTKMATIKSKTKTASKKNYQDSDDLDDYCAICGKSYYNKEGPNVEWLQCVRCHKWLHDTCSTNPDLCPNCLNNT